MPPLSERDPNEAFSRAVEQVKNATANLRKVVDTDIHASQQREATRPKSTIATMPEPLQARSTSNINVDNSAIARAKADDDISIDFESSFIVKYNCNQIRTRIRTFINNGGMKVGEFQDKLNISARSYQLFMKQSGPHGGMNSDTYPAAHQFFVARENAGLKMPRAKKAKPSAETEKKLSVDNAENPTPRLDGEDNGTVPVFDTCDDDVRRKIELHLRKSGMTMAAFARELSKCIPGEETVSSKNVTDFRNKKGAMAGNTSKAFYAAYVYFEKLRVRDNKPKSKKRQEMEKEHGARGVPVERDLGPNARFWARADERPYMGKYGTLEFS